MATVGYVTVEEASIYVSMHYASTDALRVAWEAMTEADQAVYLLRSYDLLERLPFVGKKYQQDQTSQFPRWPNEEVPQDIKDAQVANAVSLTDSSHADDDEFYEKLWQYGVESYRIGNFSESSSNGSWSKSRANKALASPVATKLVQPYLNGGYRIG